MVTFYIVAALILAAAITLEVKLILCLINRERKRFLYWDEDSLKMCTWDEIKDRQRAKKERSRALEQRLKNN